MRLLKNVERFEYRKWYSRYVLSWRLSYTLDADFCIEALEEALKKGRPEKFNTGRPYYALSYRTLAKVFTSTSVAITKGGMIESLTPYPIEDSGIRS